MSTECTTVVDQYDAFFSQLRKDNRRVTNQWPDWKRRACGLPPLKKDKG